MADKEKDIRDDEFRVIGKPSTSVSEQDEKGKGPNRLVSILSLILVLGIGIVAILKWPKEKPEEPEAVEGDAETILHNIAAGYAKSGAAGDENTPRAGSGASALRPAHRAMGCVAHPGVRSGK